MTDYNYPTVDDVRADRERLRKENEELRGRLSDSTRIPEGWKLVPQEPTEAMLLACGSVVDSYAAQLIWKRMCLVAPEAPK